MKKTKLVVKNDYESNFSWELYKDNLHDLLYGLDVRVENENDRMSNVLSRVNSHIKASEYKHYLSVDCKGYSQSEWDEYKIYFDYDKGFVEEISRIEDTLEELKKLYTHKNDYVVQKIEELDSGHTKKLESFHFSILDIEFPSNSDIKYRIDEEMIEYDEIEFNQN